MKVELSHTRTRLDQMMGMMQKLLHDKSADGGQQDEESGGTGRGENDDSGGAGRAPHEEEAAGPKIGTTTATAAGGRMSNHSSRASDGS